MNKISTKTISKLKTFEGLLWLVPFLIPYLIFTLAMLTSSFVLSFSDYKIIGDKTFIGIENYKTLMGDIVFWQALGNTFKFVLLSTPVLILFPLFLGIFIDNKVLFSKSFFRVSFFAPFVLPVSVVAYTFLYMFQPYTGLINNLLKSLHLLGGSNELFWLMDTKLVWITIIFETLWWSGGFNLIIYIAGLQDIPPQYYESAEIDGANTFHKIFFITLPLLGRVHVVILFLQLVSSFKVFGQVYLLTGGDPGGGTRTYIQYLYESGFRTFQIGKASAAAFILFGIILVISFIQFSVTSKYNK